MQRAFMAHHGLQCGFCTPGFLMLATNALERDPHIGEEALIDLLSSNLCRCTGYQNIVKSVRAAQDEMRPPTTARVEPAQPSEHTPAGFELIQPADERN
jgi:aerobic carbon-monoxide dehydrogenase small subunit